MEPDKEQVSAANSEGALVEELEVKSQVKAEEQADYIAAMSNDSVEASEVVSDQSVEPTVEPAAAIEVSEAVVTEQANNSIVEGARVEPKPKRLAGLIEFIKKQPRRKKVIMAGAIVVVIVAGSFSVSRLVSDGNVAGLTPDNKNGIAFSRPSNWQQSKEEDGLVYYTEGASEVADMNRGMILGVQTLGVRYSALADEDKANIRKSFESGFSSGQTLSGDQCGEITNVQTTELNQEGYDLAYRVDAECPQLRDGKTGGKIKMFIGWNDVNLHVVGVVADSPTWQAEGLELEAIANSVRPE